MQVVDVGQGDVECGALNVAWRDAGTSEVNDHLALRCHGRGDEPRLVRGVLDGRGGLDEHRGGAGNLSGKTAEHSGGGQVFEGFYLGGDAVYSARLLEGIVSHEATAIDVGGVDGVVDVAEQTALAERGLPDAQFVDKGDGGAAANGQRGALQRRHVGLGDDSGALTVEIERGGLSANHVQGYMMPA